MKRFLSLFLILALVLTFLPSTHADAAVKLNKKSVTITVGQTTTLKVTGTTKTVKWTSSKKSVATVSSKGVVTGKSVGKAKISAKIGKKTYTCVVTVKNDYSKWVKYSTSNIKNLVEGIRDGYIVMIDGKYYCSPEYYEMISNEEIIYENDISDNSNNDIPTLDPDIEVEFVEGSQDESDADYNARLQERINEMMKTGSASSDDLNTDIAKAYKEFCKTWVSEYELKNSYNISVVWNWPSNQIYLIKGIDSKYIIDNAPDKFENRKIYSGSGVQYQYLDKFIYNNDSYIENQFYFNRDDLKNVGVIK